MWRARGMWGERKRWRTPAAAPPPLSPSASSTESLTPRRPTVWRPSLHHFHRAVFIQLAAWTCEQSDHHHEHYRWEKQGREAEAHRRPWRRAKYTFFVTSNARVGDFSAHTPAFTRQEKARALNVISNLRASTIMHRTCFATHLPPHALISSSQLD